ncbi:MAG: response regulator [Lachnospiraceae bacterium]|nr:response regulator [Lachnospiraceae bacterium]
MFKLIIVDDERIIRESISALIDWKTLDIELVGVCANGIEAYNAILDEAPDIVITDIRMPGMSGLELIKKAAEMDLDTQFIILSGYGEFEYAKEGMRYGVRNYLLKPCNEQQILEAVQKTIQDVRERQQRRKIKESTFLAADTMRHNVISSLLNDALYTDADLETAIGSYEPYLDFYHEAYRLFYIYYLEPAQLSQFLRLLKDYCETYMAQISLYSVYVKNTFLLFCSENRLNDQAMEAFLKKAAVRFAPVSLEIQNQRFSSLTGLLSVLLEKIRRYSSIYYIHNFHPFYTFNYTAVSHEMEKLYLACQNGDAAAVPKLLELLGSISDFRFFKQLSISLVIKASASDSTAALTSWLKNLENEENPDAARQRVTDKLSELLLSASPSEKPHQSSSTRQIIDYIEQNLSNPNLTLKYIAEQQLYMNVDYVSRRFQKETETKFSSYLADLRIQKARELLTRQPQLRVQDVAEQIGFGNNPQYFSQLFKKKLGITPSNFAAELLS